MKYKLDINVYVLENRFFLFAVLPQMYVTCPFPALLTIEKLTETLFKLEKRHFLPLCRKDNYIFTWLFYFNCEHVLFLYIVKQTKNMQIL